MILTIRHILKFTFFFFTTFIYSQEYKNDSLQGSFTYLLKAKLNNLQPEQIHKEFFSLQISNNRSFFISEKSIKIDSIILAESNSIPINGSNTTIDFRGKSLPKTKFKYLIIQTNDDVKYYETIGMTLFSYNSAKINNWKIINETKLINSLLCRKATVSFKGREWIAWYSTEIPFTFGPYKFGGLPGLIVKITDQTGDYDFELVQSKSNSDLKGQIIAIDKYRYQNSILITKQELDDAKQNFRKNLFGSMESMGVIMTPEVKENFLQRQKNIELEKKSENPIELLE